MTYTINLFQSSGEIQTEFSSDSYEEILGLWEACKNEQDEYTELDETLVLYKGDEVLAKYQITDDQRES